MRTSINIPENYRGQPMVHPAARGAHSPYNDLEVVSGCSCPVREIRRIGEIALERQSAAEAITMILPENRAHWANPTLPTVVRELVMPRVGGDGCFFVTNETGTLVGASRPNECFAGKEFETVGAFSPKLRDALDAKRNQATGLLEEQSLFMPALVNVPRRGMILETGAGADYARLAVLQEHARGRDAYLICHDPAPPLPGPTLRLTWLCLPIWNFCSPRLPNWSVRWS